MSIFDLDPVGQRTVAQDVQANGVDVTNLQPGFFDGAASGIGSGVMRGGARVGQFLGMAAAAPVVLFDKAAGTQYADAAFRAIDNTVNSAVDYWTPAPNELGTAGRVLGGLSEIALPLMAGGGNPTMLIGSQEMGTATDLVRQGADAKAAVGAGIAQGAATAIGFKIPFVGKTFLGKAASGAAGNLVTNAGASAVTQQLLKATGDDALAEQFNPFDAEARMVDVLTGIAFGGLAHLATRPAPSVRDAAIAASNAKHFQQDTAPGIPADPLSGMAHHGAMEVATKDLLEGRPVDVGQTKVGDAEFLRRPDEALVTPQIVKDFDAVREAGQQIVADAISEYSPAEFPKVEAVEPVASIEPEPTRGPPAEPIDDPIVAGAYEIASLTDHQIPIADDNGNITTMSSKQLLADSAQAVKQAEIDGNGFMAAATCFLQVGA